MAQAVLGELNVHLLCYPGVDRSQRSGFAAQIELCGGRVRRFSREVTHVVVLRPFNAAEADIAAGDAELRKVFDKIEQTKGNVRVVSGQWVAECLKQGHRLPEHHYSLTRPHEPIKAAKSPATAGRSAKKRCMRGAAAVGGTTKKIAAAAALDVNEALFSSSQQLQELSHDRHQRHLQQPDPLAEPAAAAKVTLLPEDSPSKGRQNHRVIINSDSPNREQQQQQHLKCQALKATQQTAAGATSINRDVPDGLLFNLLPSSMCLGPTTQLAAELLAALPDSEFDAVAGFGDRARMLHAPDPASTDALAARDGPAGNCDSMSRPVAGLIAGTGAEGDVPAAAAATPGLPLAGPAALCAEHRANISWKKQQQPEQQPTTTTGDAADNQDHDKEVTDEIEDSDDDFQQQHQRAPCRTATAALPRVGNSNAAAPLPATGASTSGWKGRHAQQLAAAAEAAADIASVVHTPAAVTSPAAATGARAQSAAKISHGARAASAPVCAGSAAAAALPGAAAAASAGKAGLSAKAALSGLKKRRSSAHHAATVMAASATTAADQHGPVSVPTGQFNSSKGHPGHQDSQDGVRVTTPVVAGNSRQAQQASLQPQQRTEGRLSGGRRGSSSGWRRADDAAKASAGTGAGTGAGDIVGLNDDHDYPDTILLNLQVQQPQEVYSLLHKVSQPRHSGRHDRLPEEAVAGGVAAVAVLEQKAAGQQQQLQLQGQPAASQPAVAPSQHHSTPIALEPARNTNIRSSRKRGSFASPAAAVATAAAGSAGGSRSVAVSPSGPDMPERRVPARLAAWHCSICTYLNPPGSAKLCEMCGFSKPKASEAAPGMVAAPKPAATSPAAAAAVAEGTPAACSRSRGRAGGSSATAGGGGTLTLQQGVQQPQQSVPPAEAEAAGQDVCWEQAAEAAESASPQAPRQSPKSVLPAGLRHQNQDQHKEMEQPVPESPSHAQLTRQGTDRQEIPATHQQQHQQQQAIAGHVASTCYAGNAAVGKCRSEAAAAAVAAAAPICLPRGAAAHTPASGRMGRKRRCLESATASSNATASNVGATSNDTVAAAGAADAVTVTPVLKSLVSRTQRRKLLAKTQQPLQQQAAAGRGATFCKPATKTPLGPSIRHNEQQQQQHQQADSSSKQTAALAATAGRKSIVGKRSAAPTAAAAADGDDEQMAGPSKKRKLSELTAGPADAGAAAVRDQHPAAQQLPGKDSSMPPQGVPRGTGGVSSSTQGSRGYIAWTSVSSAVADLAKAAAQRLPGGLRVCVEGHEEGRVTHLVVGAERRTLKLLLALAQGAWLLRPEWVTASLEKGAWEPPEGYEVHNRFSEVAGAVRAGRAAGGYTGPLSGRLVTIHCQAAARGAFASQKAAAEHRQSLQRLVRALGGRICGAKVAQLAVVAGVPALPCELPTSATVVGEEWLLHLAETHSSETADNYAGFELQR